MTAIREEIERLQSSIEKAEERIERLRSQCSHTLTFVSQNHWTTEGYSTDVTFECTGCGAEIEKSYERPVCPVHLNEMHHASDVKSLDLARKKQKTLDPHSFYSAIPFMCPQKDCEERIILVVWDR